MARLVKTVGGTMRKSHKILQLPLKTLRVAPEGRGQRRFQQGRGDELVAEFDLNIMGLITVNQRDGVNWVIDGQHRLHALKELGFGEYDIECMVYEDLTDAEAASVFIGLNKTLKVTPFATFANACTAGATRELAILRAVQTNGLKISQSKAENCVGAVSALTKVYDAHGATVLGQSLRTIKQGFAGDGKAFDANLIIGLGHTFGRFNGQINEQNMASRLSSTPLGAGGVLRRARSQRDKTGNQLAQCVAAAVVEIYNGGRRGRACLPDWWKSADKDTK